MDSVLGRKQRIKNSDWIEIFDKIEQLITKKELDQLVDKTIQDIKAKTKGKKAAIIRNQKSSAVKTSYRCISGFSSKNMQRRNNNYRNQDSGIRAEIAKYCNYA